MVLIISEANDLSTSKVIEYLNSFKIKFIRINCGDKLVIKKGTISNEKIDFHFELNDSVTFNYSDISFYWHRRGFIKTFFDFDIISDNFIKNYCKIEYEKFNEFLNFLFLKKPHLGSTELIGINKLSVLTVFSVILKKNFYLHI